MKIGDNDTNYFSGMNGTGAGPELRAVSPRHLIYLCNSCMTIAQLRTYNRRPDSRRFAGWAGHLENTLPRLQQNGKDIIAQEPSSQ